MLRLVYIFIILSLGLSAQDKIFLKSGQILNGEFVSLGKQEVYFKYKDSTQTSILNKYEVLLIDCSNGERYVIGDERKTLKSFNTDSSITQTTLHAFGIQPFGVLFGRVTFAYEHFFSSGRFGLCIPLSLTFDPFGVLYNSAADTSVDSPEHIPGVGFIMGLDLNYYFLEKAGSNFFMGPRIRYGTDKMLRGLEGISVQFQLGIHIKSGRSFSQHFSVGYGFVKILNLPSGSTFNPDQLSGWCSVNYRINLLR